MFVNNLNVKLMKNFNIFFEGVSSKQSAVDNPRIAHAPALSVKFEGLL
jgi:hypothetical protein